MVHLSDVRVMITVFSSRFDVRFQRNRNVISIVEKLYQYHLSIKCEAKFKKLNVERLEPFLSKLETGVCVDKDLACLPNRS